MEHNSSPDPEPPREPAPPGESAWEKAERAEEEEKYGPGGVRRVPWGIGDAIIALVIAFIVLIIVSILFGVSSQARVVTRFAPVIGSVVGYAIFVVVVWMIAIRIRGGTPSNLGFNKFSVPSAIFQAVIWWIITRVLTALYFVTASRLGVRLPVQQAERIVRLFGRGFLGLILALIVAVIIAPLVEELLFRGFVYSAFRQSVGVGWAILINGLLFALVHADPFLFVPLAIIGFALAWLYERSNSLGPPIFLHALNNLISIVALYVAAGGISG
ncbi:MAG: CPBP family intramembrane metalloprotease [Actinobacteria bacterium]|nr:CPBP family intramembrane metalloprotease [Actinomycetota bacterium]